MTSCFSWAAVTTASASGCSEAIERYLEAVQKFAKFFGKSPQRLGPEEVRKFLLHLVQERKAAPSTVQIYRAALKFLYVKTLHQPWFDERIPRARKRQRLPAVLRGIHDARNSGLKVPCARLPPSEAWSPDGKWLVG